MRQHASNTWFHQHPLSVCPLQVAMSIDNDPAVTRVTLVLNKPVDWHSWLFIRKDTCLQHNLWEFVNPDTPDAERPTFSPPVKPKPADYKAGCTQFCQLGAEDGESFK